MKSTLTIHITIVIDNNNVERIINENINIPIEGENFYRKSSGNLKDGTDTLDISYYARNSIVDSYMLIKNTGSVNEVDLLLGSAANTWTVKVPAKTIAIYRMLQLPYSKVTSATYAEFLVVETNKEV